VATALRSPIGQAGVVAIREDRVCIISSRGGKRWLVPRGCCEHGRTQGQTALQEAWEEAGLVGVLERDPVGSYLYRKAGGLYHVTLFRMRVTGVARDWPERPHRRRLWLAPEAALARIADRGLRDILRTALLAPALS
jgi:8-oxo-dGTP pyrophosphatase MutT (NUDIX family)